MSERFLRNTECCCVKENVNLYRAQNFVNNETNTMFFLYRLRHYARVLQVHMFISM